MPHEIRLVVDDMRETVEGIVRAVAGSPSPTTRMTGRFAMPATRY
ncbi:hypothetical protein J2W42_001355 [Rhizobium tibeticum]|nr:hypothetical protein [Rhizobium tibeticum]MDP9808517.1 hypothetical protein [Rhizobium tibeticum]